MPALGNGTCLLGGVVFLPTADRDYEQPELHNDELDSENHKPCRDTAVYV